MSKYYSDVNEKCLKNREKFKVFDDILPHVGDFGKYQWFLISTLTPFGLAFLTVFFSQILLTAVPQKHWCKVDELANLNLTQEQKIQLAIPKSKQYPFYDRCHYKKLDFPNIREDNFNFSKWETDDIVECNQWEYDLNEIPYASIGAELNWVCDQEYLIAATQSIFYIGSVFGNFIFGWISDRKGRINGLLCCTATAFLASIGTANSHNFLTFALSRFLMGFAFDNIIMIPLIIEYVSTKKRFLIGCFVLGINIALGLLFVTWTSYLIKNWRYFAYFNALTCLFCFGLTIYMPESARWYLSKGKTDKILKKLRRISQVNAKIPDERIITEYLESLTYGNKNIENANLLDLRSTPTLFKNIVLLAIIFSFSTLMMDTHIYYSNRYNMSIFMSFTWFSLEIIIASILATLTSIQWGLRFSGSLALLSNAVFSLTFAFTKNENIKTVAGSIGRLSMSFVQTIYSQYVPEFFPTTLRTQGTALVHFMSVLIHFGTPYIIVLASTWRELPMLIIGTIALINSVLILFLPETSGTNLRQTLQDGENFCKNKKFWPIFIEKRS